MSALPRTLVTVVAMVLVACGGATLPPEPGVMDPVQVPAEMIVIGDFGSGSDAQYAVAESIQRVVAEADVELFLTTGDNFYNDDLDRIWNKPYGWLDDENIRIAAAWGNHDRESDTREDLVEEALSPPGAYYSMEMGEGKLIVLDSNNVSDPDQTTWLRDQLEGAGSPAIVVFHHPPYTCGVYGTEDVVNDAWLPIIEEFDVPLVLNGHEHHYERLKVEGTTYVVTGGGGQSLRDARGCPEDTPQPLASNYADHHFVTMSIGNGAISAEVIAADGSIIDTFEIGY
jgi:Icc-related predicted phosphoesterase